MNSKEPAYIVIPVHNRKQITLACLANLEQLGDLNRYGIIVIDDGSTDGTTSAIHHLYPEVIVLNGDGNLWWTGAIVKGMEYAYEQKAEFFIWLNDDCQLSKDTLSNLVSYCRQHPDSIIGCQGVASEKPDAIAFGGKQKTWKGYRFIYAPQNRITPCDLLSGNLVCIPRAVVDEIGYPDPRLTPHYGGDSLYLIRAKKAGFEIFVDSRTCVTSLPGEPALYPRNWLLVAGEPLRLLKLVFTLQSGLSWRVWLQLNWETYSIWGIAMFLKKYASILLITALRFLPLTIRKRLFQLK